jgi:hypothetical protein
LAPIATRTKPPFILPNDLTDGTAQRKTAYQRNRQPSILSHERTYNFASSFELPGVKVAKHELSPLNRMPGKEDPPT